MKKKYIIPAVIVFAIILCVVIFIGGSSDETPQQGQAITVNLEKETTRKPLFSPDFDKSITVILPMDYVDAQYRDNLEAFAEKNGYYSISAKGDDKVKIEMREYSYQLLLTTVGMETVTGIASLIDSGDYPFLLSLEKYNDDFSEIYLSVNREEYEKASEESLNDLFSTAAVYCLYYQNYVQDSKDTCRVILYEEETNLLIEKRELTQKDLV